MLSLNVISSNCSERSMYVNISIKFFKMVVKKGTFELKIEYTNFIYQTNFMFVVYYIIIIIFLGSFGR